MAYPATSGKLCTNIKDMAIGDYIGAFTTSDRGSLWFDDPKNYDLPIGTLKSDSGNCYLIKVDKGLLISDRNIANWSGDTANSYSALTGCAMTVNSQIGKAFVRAPSYAEWDQYIVNSDLNGTIVKQDPKVWNTDTNPLAYNESPNYSFPQHPLFGSWLQDTIGSTRRVAVASSGDYIRDTALAYLYLMCTNLNSSINVPCYIDPSKVTTYFQNIVPGTGGCFNQINLSVGYRPVVEYIDNPKSTTVFM